MELKNGCLINIVVDVSILYSCWFPKTLYYILSPPLAVVEFSCRRLCSKAYSNQQRRKVCTIKNMLVDVLLRLSYKGARQPLLFWGNEYFEMEGCIFLKSINIFIANKKSVLYIYELCVMQSNTLIIQSKWQKIQMKNQQGTRQVFNPKMFRKMLCHPADVGVPANIQYH